MFIDGVPYQTAEFNESRINYWIKKQKKNLLKPLALTRSSFIAIQS